MSQGGIKKIAREAKLLEVSAHAYRSIVYQLTLTTCCATSLATGTRTGARAAPTACSTSAQGSNCPWGALKLSTSSPTTASSGEEPFDGAASWSTISLSRALRDLPYLDHQCSLNQQGFTLLSTRDLPYFQ